MSHGVSAGIKSLTTLEVEIKGDFTETMGCMDFSSFCTK